MHSGLHNILIISRIPPFSGKPCCFKSGERPTLIMPCTVLDTNVKPNLQSSGADKKAVVSSFIASASCLETSHFTAFYCVLQRSTLTH